MSFKRGDIINVYFELSNSDNAKWHPGLIISNNEVFEDDDCYIVVMLTGSTTIDKYSFEIKNNMLDKPLAKSSQVRCHLITYILSKHLTDKKVLATMRSPYVDSVVTRIVDSVLS